MSINCNNSDAISKFNTPSQFPVIKTKHTNLLTLLKFQKDLNPLAPAVVFEQQILTRENLWQYTESMAEYLKANIGCKDRCIGIYVEPSISMMYGAWGIMLSGNGYLPLSPEYPEERLRYMLEDSLTEVVFTQEHLRSQFEKLAPSNIHIFTDQDVEKFNKEPKTINTSDEEYLVPSDALAYIIYTSGSTGKPKGVMVDQCSIVNQMHWLANEYQISAQTRILQKTPMSFDAAQWEILSPACGATVIMGAPGIYKDPPRLIAAILRYQVTAIQCVPTLLQAILDDDDVLKCVSLRQIFSGGEALHKHLARHCLETLQGIQLINLYGPTECTINSSACIVNEDTLETEFDVVSIGRPIYNTIYYILDDQMLPVATGETGELYISGVCLARGYLNKPEMTKERFIKNPFHSGSDYDRIYKTGDLARWGENGFANYVGRVDNQIKLRGYRIELDEIKSAIEKHQWVRHAAVIVKNDPNTGYQNLISFVELNDKEATLMDQGIINSHHQSKTNKAQVYMQISNAGCRDDKDGGHIISLPGSLETTEQRSMAFGRKTYRHYEGGSVTEQDLLEMLAEKIPTDQSTDLSKLSVMLLGSLLRYFGCFTSKERILSKYTWSSPGALYATQLYVELVGISEIENGIYYYHPIKHQLVYCSTPTTSKSCYFGCHFIGKKSAIEPIYKNNIQEVLNFEAGHMQGVLDYILPSYGLSIISQIKCPEVKSMLDVAEEDYYLTSCCIDSYVSPETLPVDIIVQVMNDKVTDLTQGTYLYKGNRLQYINSEIVQKKHVIAINQKVYESASFGIALLSWGEFGWSKYVTLGRKMQHLMNNTKFIGFMASGYSSDTGNDLPSATVLKKILSMQPDASYFCIGGRITKEQKMSEGMKEDSIHMKGPAEILRDDLEKFLPAYMLPNKILVLENLPLTANGKIDITGLLHHKIELVKKDIIEPRDDLEKIISDAWKTTLKQPQLSIDDNFFEVGGNSLIAVSLVTKINKKLNCNLPIQVIFSAPTIEKIAMHISAQQTNSTVVSRLIPLHQRGNELPIFCWPGLGGYCMNLRTLAVSQSSSQPFYGIQANGINDGEAICQTIKEMAEQDIKLIKHKQPHGPYVLWGYSFGARVAFEAAWQLECAGEQVKELILIAPGSPKVRQQQVMVYSKDANYTNPAYLTILFSVFMGSIKHPLLENFLLEVKTRNEFIDFISEHQHSLTHSQIERITDIVSQTFEFTYSFNELNERKINASISIIKADGDDYSFIENCDQFSISPPNVIKLNADHYQLLKEEHIDELLDAIHSLRKVIDSAR